MCTGPIHTGKCAIAWRFLLCLIIRNFRFHLILSSTEFSCVRLMFVCVSSAAAAVLSFLSLSLARPLLLCTLIRFRCCFPNVFAVTIDGILCFNDLICASHTATKPWALSGVECKFSLISSLQLQFRSLSISHLCQSTFTSINTHTRFNSAELSECYKRIRW